MEVGGPEVEGGIGVRGGSGDEEEEEEDDGESEWLVTGVACLISGDPTTRSSSSLEYSVPDSVGCDVSSSSIS